MKNQQKQDQVMQLPLLFFFLACSLCLAFCLASCGKDSPIVLDEDVVKVAKTKGFQAHYGPFDANGNYVDSWADRPPLRRYVSKEKAQASAQKIASRITPPEPVYSPPPRTFTARKKTPSLPKAKKIKKTKTSVANKPKRKKIQDPVAKIKRKMPVAIRLQPNRKKPISHTVVKGDTLYNLGLRYRSSAEAIRSANKLKSNNIRLGQTLKIPRF